MIFKSKHYKMICCSMIIPLIFNIVACNSNIAGNVNKKEIIASQKNVSYVQKPFMLNDLEVISLINGNDIIIQRMKQDNGCIFVKYDLVTGKEKQIIELKNFIANNNSSCILNKKLFFFITESLPSSEFLISLCEIDLLTYEFRKVFEDKTNSPTIRNIDVTANGKLLSKGISISNDGNIIKTFIESFDPQKGERKIIIREEANVEEGKKSGTFINSFSIYADKIYIISETMNNESIKTNLNQYQDDKLIKTINLDEFKTIFANQGLDMFKVYEDMIYVVNNSSKAMIGKIVGDKVSAITVLKNDLEMARGLGMPLFFERWTRNIYTYIDGTIKKVPTANILNENIVDIIIDLKNKNNIYITTKDPNKSLNSNVLYIDRTKLLNK